jgi:hypothetical protein
MPVIFRAELLLTLLLWGIFTLPAVAGMVVLFAQRASKGAGF